MKHGRRGGAAVVGAIVMALTATLAGTAVADTPVATNIDATAPNAAAAPWDTLAPLAVAQSASATGLALTIPFVGVSTDGKTCTGEFGAQVGYNKPSGQVTNYEWGKAKYADSCTAYTNVTLSGLITDLGLPFLSTPHSQAVQGSTNGPNAYVYANPEQYVPLYTFPADWHAQGSSITWSFRLHIQWAPGWSGDSDLCLGAIAAYGGPVVQTPCQ
jgi:hypothetical protein